MSLSITTRRPAIRIVLSCPVSISHSTSSLFRESSRAASAIEYAFFSSLQGIDASEDI